MGLSFCSYTTTNLAFCLLLVFRPTLAYFTSSRQSFCHDDERSALLQFKESLTINKTASCYPFAYSKTQSWKVEEGNDDCCSWDGIKCNEDTGHVIRLDLTSSYLYGSINSNNSLFQLFHLQWLSLADNDFNYSEIPSKIMNLSRLTYLDLSFSSFFGQIPSEILELSELVLLNVSYNDGLEFKKGGLRSLAEMLSKLKKLDLAEVYMSFSIPHTLTNLSSLAYLSLEDCEVQGELPTKIFQLPNLYFLNVQYNEDLTVYLPEFERNSLLAELRLSGTRISGGIPNSIGNLKSLSYLGISGCHLQGTVPSSLGNLTHLRYLFLSDNEFSGEPTFIGNLGSLEMLDLSQNNFLSQKYSSLSWIANLTKLTYLDIYNNIFGQDISSLFWIANLTKLTHLDLSYNNFLSQNISSLIWIANLIDLTYLDLSANNFSSLNISLLSSIATLTKLTHLDLSKLNFVGEIPTWLLKMNQMQDLLLMQNQLSGKIPFEIGNLTQLEILVLASNRLKGSIPNSIFELKNLWRLDLQYNNLSGTMNLDMFLLNLKSLEVLVLSSNNLSVLTETTVYDNLRIFRVIGLGSCNLIAFPNFLQKQEHLKSLDLSSNKIAGQIPRWLSFVGVKLLEYLNLSYNQLTGFEQHAVVLPWTNIVTLDLRSNNLQGPLPLPSVSIFTYLVSVNQLTGTISLGICNLNLLHALDLSYNNLSGKLPLCLGKFSNELSVLKLQGNKFFGSIPQIFMKETNLRMIDLSHNLLHGRIPRTLANCKKLEFINFGSNLINDVFPSYLGTLPKLKVLILQRNNFYGVIKEPKIDAEFPELRIIDLSYNRFTGNLPIKYFQHWNAMKVINTSQLTYMQDDLYPNGYPIDTYYGPYAYSLTLSNKGMEMEYRRLSNLVTGIVLSSNEFEGGIPTSIGNLKGLHNLNFSNNHLRGGIPSSLSNLTVLESLDLSNNKLSGEIPQNLVELTSLEYFNVSHNNLTGPIPHGNQFSTFTDSSLFDGNPGLCGKPLPKRCESPEASEKEIPKALEKGDQGTGSPFAFGWKVVLIGYVSGLIIGVALGYIFATRKHEWLVKTFGWQLKRNVKRKSK